MNKVTNTTRSGAQCLVDCLVKQGVKRIYGIPGAKIDAVFDALLDSPIELILCRHEQNAAFMAAIQGRLTSEPGVVLVTSGPGVSNLATGLLTATTEGDAVVAIGGNVPRTMKFRQSHQSTDNVELMDAATKYCVEVVMPENIPELIENAFRIAKEPKSGAAFISLPQDVLTDTVSVLAHGPMAAIERGAAPLHLLQQAAQLIAQAKTPVLLLGQEASRYENAEAVRMLLKKIPIATVSTYQAAGVIARDLLHCFVGRVGLFKNQPGDQLLDDADVVITVGYNPVEYDPEVWNLNCQRHIIHLDYNPTNIHTAYLPEVEIIGEIATNIKALSELLPHQEKIRGVEKVRPLQENLEHTIESGANYSGESVHPLRFIYELRQLIDDETIVISDIGTHYMWLARYFFSYQPHHLLFSNGQQTLGVALPWAIATTFTKPNTQVISISGDGGFLFSAMELETAVRHDANFVHCVWCDGSYDMVRQQQLLKYKRDTAVKFGSIDLVKFAESFGAVGMRINHSDEVKSCLEKAFKHPGPVIMEVPIDYSDNPELFMAVKEDFGN